MEPLFLSREEIAELTGFRHPTKQTNWLQRKGWRFEINANRAPIVARKYAEKMLGCGGSDEPIYKPNFTKLRAV